MGIRGRAAEEPRTFQVLAASGRSGVWWCGAAAGRHPWPSGQVDKDHREEPEGEEALGKQEAVRMGLARCAVCVGVGQGSQGIGFGVEREIFAGGTYEDGREN
ncbi:hypothetical protein E2562_024375 [Oryza meyeriana var. granulata]|uniref:Uncharacterized protein n=1 Tax=Oryza meyeriana var. granulata TaxID=110450 RepID=A0A6G1C938_9ORYZ|nr:hypothetical protein E2562_024375 [Oryza meyeriana var. granulata]